MVGFYAPMLRHLHRDDFPKREKDLEHFVTIAARYRSLRVAAHRHGARAADRQRRRRARGRRDDEGLLTLSTIHSAKGLEWHAVFVIWMVDGRFPSYHNLHDDDEIEEERRLLYVAVTRAKEHLYLTLPDRHLRPRHRAWCSASRRASSRGCPTASCAGVQVVDDLEFGA